MNYLLKDLSIRENVSAILSMHRLTWQIGLGRNGAVLCHGLLKKVPIVIPRGQVAKLVFVGISVSYDVLLHLENDLVDKRVVQDKQVEHVLGVAPETSVFPIR